MRASDCSFEELRIMSSGIPRLSFLLSYVQVENGLKDLETSWQAFIDISNESGTIFNDKREICLIFGEELREVLELQSVSEQMGLSLCKIS